MLFISVEDFLTQAKTAPCISWDEKKSLAQAENCAEQGISLLCIKYVGD